MQINTKLNLGDIIWIFKLPLGVISQKIKGIGADHFAGVTEVTYMMSNDETIEEKDCGIHWWTSQQTAEDAISNTLAPKSQAKCQYPNFKSPCDIGRKPEPRDDDDEVDETLDFLFEELKNESKKQEPQGECKQQCCHHDHQSIEDVLADWPKKPTGFQSEKPKHVTEEEAFIKELERQSRKLTDENMEKIEKEFDAIFGEHVCSNPSGFKSDLNHLYDELFGNK